MYKAVDLFVQIIGYCLFIIGLWVFISPIVLSTFKRLMQYTRFRSALSVNSNSIDNALLRHINMLIHIVFNTYQRGSVSIFLIVSFALFFVTFIVFLKGGLSIVFCLIFSAMFGLLPYIYLRIRLVSIRIEGSYEAEELVSELRNQYKICNFNMVEAIDCTIPLLNRCRHTQRALFRLSLSIKDYKYADTLDNIIQEFVYALDTEWAALLGINIKIALSDGRDISASLDDILEEIKQIKVIIENDKRNNNEAFSMIRFVVPAVYILSVFVSINFFGFSLDKFLRYQFNTDIGLKFAVITFLSMLANYIVYYIIRKPKYDF